MEPRLVLFDIDGTLIDTARAGRHAMEQACRDVFGVDGVDVLAAGVSYAGRTDPLILESVAGAIGIRGERFVAGVAALRSSYLQSLRLVMQREEPRRRVLPGVRTLLETLDALEPVHLGLITGNFEEGARIKLEPFDLNRFFPGGGFSSDHRDRREIARIAVQKMSVLSGIPFRPPDVCVVGDTEHDVDCARANGYRSVAVDSGWVSRESLEAVRPDALLDDMSDLELTLDALGLAGVA